MRIYVFLGGMWILMILGGGMAVLGLGPLKTAGEPWLESLLQAMVAILLVLLWIAILLRMQRYLLN